jgi:predicted solute-binding protein
MPSLVARYHEHNRRLLEELQLAAGPGMEMRDLTPTEASWTLLESETDLGLISPLLFGKRESDLALMGGACVAAVGATAEWLLHFRSGLRSIDTVGYFGDRGMPSILAEILLKEKYGMFPRMQQLPMPTEALPATALLASVDAVLSTGESQRDGFESTPHLDVIDEWFDLTQLPLVLEVFIGWESRMDAAIDAAIRAAGETADAEALHSVDLLLQGRNAATEREILPGHFRYRFTEEVIEGLQAFFQMAFFHGLHRDIPGFVFWSEDAPAS